MYLCCFQGCYHEGMDKNLVANIILGLLICTGGIILIRKFRPRKSEDNMLDSSLLYALHVPGSGLTKISDGKLGAYNYSIMLSASSDAEHSSPVLSGGAIKPGATILALTLPFRSSVHLAGLGMPQNNTVDSLARKAGLQPVVLEGDFPDYFRLYCGTNEQIDLLTVIDPSDMAFLVDYCQKENWEVIGNTIYFSQHGHSADNNPEIKDTTLVEDALIFCQRIVPTLKRLAS